MLFGGYRCCCIVTIHNHYAKDPRVCCAGQVFYKQRKKKGKSQPIHGPTVPFKTLCKTKKQWKYAVFL
jgi:hypothetical protein